ncbi:44596_t:CDS:2 [Gigaspora margarita]|uniref:44596_t:CDS:1 n=1 Tax=Gigaspora margarita TaxID=4874 RepID=A0ABN7UPF2_GIGMA|nr:44596_t:CDS:2 [Gigaspora margarita]
MIVIKYLIFKESGFKPASEVDPLWITQFEEYVKDTQPDLNINQISDKRMLAILVSEFVVVIKKHDKSEFKADSLYNGICAINRYFIEKFKEIGPFNLHDILHSRMQELEEIHNGAYQDTPIGLFRQIILWIGCCAAKRGGSYLDIMASHFEERQDGGFNLLTIHDKTHKGGYYHRNTSGSGHNTPSQIIPPDELGKLKKGNWYTPLHMGRYSLSKVLKTICELTRIYCIKWRIINLSLRKTTAQKLNDNNVDPQAIMNITLHRSMAGLNQGSQNETTSSFDGSNIQDSTEVNTDQNITSTETSKIPFNETTHIISSDNKSINKRSSEYQSGEYQSGEKRPSAWDFVKLLMN